ncbi:MAG: DUF3800 domain-containing protein, partial [Actinobacteria bacterium]|nr:DUF3800 domain-containing protein [Actinomycetota bacterium]
PGYTVRHLLVGMPRHLREGRNLLVLKAFFDDSGSHDDADYFVVAGYVAPVEEWVQFEGEWQEALAEPRAITYFKSWEAHRRSKEFNGFSYAEAEEKVRRLADIIVAHVSYEVSVAIPRREYERFVSSLAGTREIQKFSNPYMFCYEYIAIMLSSTLPYLMYFQKGEKLDIVMDQQNGVVGMTMELHQKFRASPVFDVFGSISFSDDKDVLPLQAADLLAWGLNRFLTCREVKPGRERVLALPALRFLANERHLHHHASVLNLQTVDTALTLISEAHERERQDVKRSGVNATDADRLHDPGSKP